jgi:hypothetical protein
MQIGDVGDEVEAYHLVVLHNNANEINPHFGLNLVECDVVIDRAYQVVDFARRDGLLGGYEVVHTTGFNLHKVVVPIGRYGNDVNLVVATTPIEFGNGVTKRMADILGGGLFACGTYA